MFGLGIDFLNGWAMAAADGAKKERAEWPPHPDRVFMALAAAWFETGQEDAEGAVLRWLERLPSPSITASKTGERVAFKSERPSVSHVPVNDVKRNGVNKNGNPVQLPGFRPRQPRSFPVAIPHYPIVHLIWHEDLPEIHRAPFTALCRKVISVGHSASLVQMWLTDDPPPANLLPSEGFAKHRLRVFGPGRLDYLEARYNRRAVIEWSELAARAEETKGKERAKLKEQIKNAFPGGRPVSLRPEPGRWQSYNLPHPETPVATNGSIFDPRLIVLMLS
ncbi:MAG: type I-U CRISPR-associated protein Csb2, partial [Chloroflexota bacterium]